jgi:hypothetical protein
MTDARILYPQFRDEQSDSRYPFADTATLTDVSGEIVIGNDTFIDAVFFLIGGGAELHISAITVGDTTITITVSSENTTALITGTYDIFNPPTNGVVNFFDIYGRPAGSLLSTAGDLAGFAAREIGTYLFEPAATAFVASVVIPANEPGVRAAVPPTGEFMTGDIWLVGDQGVVLRAEADSVIRIDIIGVPLFKRFLCEPFSNFPAPKYLKTINDCPPDSYGNFTITATGHEAADTVLRVYPKDGTIVVDTVGRSAL